MGPNPIMTGVLIRRGLKTQTHTEGRPREDTGRGRLPENKGERPQEKTTLQITDLRLPASKTVRKYIHFVSVTEPVVLRYCNPRKLTHSPNRSCTLPEVHLCSQCPASV